ncbi:unnamed protein product [Cunninghamella blakesleeana]
MIQTTLLKYFHCNDAIQPTVKKTESFKQTNLTDYNFNRIPKRKGLILDYFKPKKKVLEQEKEKEKVFDLVLVDIKGSCASDLKCVKMNMYDSNLKYIAISYRWGELDEQLVETPDYTAHVTSFDLWHLSSLFSFIQYDNDLSNIDYLWIDAISVDQQNHTRKKETILKMNQIYQKAAYILAVPDLHWKYLLKNIGNKQVLDLMNENGEIIYNEILNNKHISTDDSLNSNNTNNSTNTDTTQQQPSNDNNDQYALVQKLENENEKLNMEIKEIKLKQEKDEIKRIYQYLAYLMDDWSKRAWVISEYYTAKEKYKLHGTPLKYWFISLLYYQKNDQPFFSYYFDDDDDDKNSKILTCEDVVDHKTFNQFVKSRFKQQSHLEMILNSNTTRNEDRFNAILPSWNKYKHIIKNENTVSDWKITNITSVRLKLYEIMDDLWDKATLLYACSKYHEDSILPSFSSYYNMDKLKIVEKCNHDNIAYKAFEEKQLEYIRHQIDEEKVTQVEQCINEYKMNFIPLWNENLTSIQFDRHHWCLSVKSNSYFIKKEKYFYRDKYGSKLSLNDHDEFFSVFIPFFTSAIPGCIDTSSIYKYSTSIYLIGNRDKNKWMLISNRLIFYESEHFCSDEYTFNIY